jgi:hypothetical protein
MPPSDVPEELLVEKHVEYIKTLDHVCLQSIFLTCVEKG